MSLAVRRVPKHPSARQALAAVALVLALRDVAQVPAASLQQRTRSPVQQPAASPLHDLQRQRQRRGRRAR